MNREDREILKNHTNWLLDKYSKKYKRYKRLKLGFWIVFWIAKSLEFLIFITSFEVLVESGEIIKFPIPWSLLIKLWTFDSLCMYMITIFIQETEDLFKVVNYYGSEVYGKWWFLHHTDYE